MQDSAIDVNLGYVGTLNPIKVSMYYGVTTAVTAALSDAAALASVASVDADAFSLGQFYDASSGTAVKGIFAIDGARLPNPRAS